MKMNVIGPALLLVGGLGAGYAGISQYLSERYLPGTSWNGYDVSLYTEEEAAAFLQDRLPEQYTLTVTDREGQKVELRAQEIEAELVLSETSLLGNDGSAAYLAAWPMRLQSAEKIETEYTLTFSEEKLRELVSARILASNADAVHPEDAFVTDYIPGTGYMVAEEKEGNYLLEEKTYEAVAEAIRTHQDSLDLAEAGCYEVPGHRAEEALLLSQAQEKNQLLTAEIVYDFGERSYTVNEDIYFSWVQEGEDGEPTVDQEALESYLRALKLDTDTAGTVRAFRTAAGNITQVKGPYGYNLSLKEEGARLTEEILNGAKVTREPEYTTTGVDRAHGNLDYGENYVEVDLTNQKVYLIQNGEVSFETSCVTGNVARGNATPPGIYPLTYKARNAVLRGPGYASPVSYWMPFNGGIGLHDATWRGSFGGQIYRNSGSHGCVNLPLSAAKTIFEAIEKGSPVVCHY